MFSQKVTAIARKLRIYSRIKNVSYKIMFIGLSSVLYQISEGISWPDLGFVFLDIVLYM